MTQLTVTIQFADEDRKRIDNLISAVASATSNQVSETPQEKPAATKSKPAPKPAATKSKPVEDDDNFDDVSGEVTATKEDVLAKLKEVSSVHGKPEAVKILKAVGSCTGMSDLSADKFGAVLEALNARLED